MEINVSKLQMILNRVVGKRECAYGQIKEISLVSQLCSVINDNILHMLQIQSYLTSNIPWKAPTDVQNALMIVDKDIKTDGFDKEACRGMINLMDVSFENSTLKNVSICGPF